MHKLMERIERFIMMSTFVTINILSIFLYILPLKMLHSVNIALFLGLTLFLILFYIVNCLREYGFIKTSDMKGLVLDDTALECAMCQQYKPERAHHCSSCKKCIKKMDHHCHWIGRCINYHNHGHFLRFLFFMVANSTCLISVNFYVIYKVLAYDAYVLTLTQIITIVVTSLIGILLFFVGAAHLVRQTIMLIRNVTFIESLHCLHFGLSEKDSPYNLGLRYNFESIFGPIKYLGFGKPIGTGMIFKKRYDVNYWPKHFRFNDNAYIEVL